MSTCAITGCALFSAQEGWSMWGDLHEEGNCWIFNAVLNQHDHPAQEEFAGEAQRSYGDAPPAELRAVHINSCFGLSYFERRGIVVVEKAKTTLNAAAEDYLKGKP